MIKESTKVAMLWRFLLHAADPGTSVSSLILGFNLMADGFARDEPSRTERGEFTAVTDQIPVLECRNLSVSYYTRAGAVPAVRRLQSPADAGRGARDRRRIRLRQVEPSPSPS